MRKTEMKNEIVFDRLTIFDFPYNPFYNDLANKKLVALKYNLVAYQRHKIHDQMHLHTYMGISHVNLMADCLMQFVLNHNYPNANPDDNYKIAFLYHGLYVYIEHFERHHDDLVDLNDGQTLKPIKKCFLCHLHFEEDGKMMKNVDKNIIYLDQPYRMLYNRK